MYVFIPVHLTKRNRGSIFTAAIVDGANIVLKLTFPDSETILLLTLSHLPTCHTLTHLVIT